MTEASEVPVRSVYVHAPFCFRRCPYCDFAVQVSSGGDPSPWIEALELELAWLRREGRFVPAPVLDTLYVGGGTPSVLGPEAMTGLAEAVGRERLAGPQTEWTAEANPESFTGEVASRWRKAGVNRLSLGAQSFQDEVLRWMGRLHGPRGSGEAVARARKAGIRNVSVDLIFGLPPSLHRDWIGDLETALALEVPHLSLYGLTVEEGTPLSKWIREGRLAAPTEERYREEYLQAVELLSAAGYRHYEVSNFAHPGFEARHNWNYWRFHPYLGIGNSAHSFLPPLRRWNLRGWDAYQKSVRKGESPVAEEETVRGDQARLERIWLSLRTLDGMSLEGLPQAGRSSVRGWVRKGLAEVEGRTFRLTASGWLLLDDIAVEVDRAFETDEPGLPAVETGEPQGPTG